VVRPADRGGVKLTIFALLRRPLYQLFPTLQRLRFMDIELDFNQRVQELAIEARDDLPPLAASQEAAAGFRDHLAELAQLSPRAVVLEAWLQLEKAATEAIRQRGVEVPSRELRSPLLLGQALEESGLLDEKAQRRFIHC
jgi:hypothetical protein